MRVVLFLWFNFYDKTGAFIKFKYNTVPIRYNSTIAENVESIILIFINLFNKYVRN